MSTHSICKQLEGEVPIITISKSADSTATASDEKGANEWIRDMLYNAVDKIDGILEVIKDQRNQHRTPEPSNPPSTVDSVSTMNTMFTTNSQVCLENQTPLTPRVKKTKIPYYPYGIIRPKCKDIIGNKCKHLGNKLRKQMMEASEQGSKALMDFYTCARAEIKQAIIEQAKQERKLAKKIASRIDSRIDDLENIICTQIEEMKAFSERFEQGKADETEEEDAMERLEGEWEITKKKFKEEIEKRVDEIISELNPTWL